MNNRIKITISWASVFIWMFLIFRLSSQGASESNGLSLGITDWIYSFFAGSASFDMEAVNHFVRKGAHFSAYLILALLTSNALRKTGFPGWRNFVMAFAICAMYAVSDEIHQLFIPGRSGQPLDVLIDSSGAAAGLGIHAASRWLAGKKHTKNRPSN